VSCFSLALPSAFSSVLQLAIPIAGHHLHGITQDKSGHKEYLAIRGVQEGAGTATVPCCPMSWPAGVAARQADRGITRRRSTASLCRESRLKAGLARRRAECGACQDVIGLQGETFFEGRSSLRQPQCGSSEAQ